MSFLNRWFKKTKEDQLAGKTAKVKVEKKEAAKKSEEKVSPEPAKAESAATAKAPVTRVAHRVLIRPLITEKAATMQSAGNKYSFIIAAWATKGNVKQAIKELYGIDPLDVNVVQVQGRRVRFGRHFGRRSDYKKAIITLPKGKNITVHEGV